MRLSMPEMRFLTQGHVLINSECQCQSLACLVQSTALGWGWGGGNFTDTTPQSSTLFATTNLLDIVCARHCSRHRDTTGSEGERNSICPLGASKCGRAEGRRRDRS